MSVIGDLSLLVNDNFNKPLNQQINDMLGLQASDNFFGNYFLLNKQYEEEEKPSISSGASPNYSQIVSNEIVVNTSGTIKISSRTSLNLDSYAILSDHARINGYVEIYVNNTLIIRGEEYIQELSGSDGVVPLTSQHTISAGITPIFSIQRGNRIKTITYLRVISEKSTDVRLSRISSVVSIYGTTVLRNNNAFIYGGDNNA